MIGLGSQLSASCVICAHVIRFFWLPAAYHRQSSATWLAQLKRRRIRVSTTERTIDVTIGKYTRTFPFGLSYFMSPGRNDSPGVTLGFWAAARRSASQPITARASSVTIKITKKVSMTLSSTTLSSTDLCPSGVQMDQGAAGRPAAFLHD